LTSGLERWLYLACLLVSFAGLLGFDHRFKLAFFADWRRAAISVGAGVAFFLSWDAFGIVLGIFFRGETPYLSGLLLAPELPIEEFFFLVVLCLTTLEVFIALTRLILKRIPSKRGTE
jgi:lycopene cyclase domain-containing protein